MTLVQPTSHLVVIKISCRARPTILSVLLHRDLRDVTTPRIKVLFVTFEAEDTVSYLLRPGRPSDLSLSVDVDYTQDGDVKIHSQRLALCADLVRSEENTSELQSLM